MFQKRRQRWSVSNVDFVLVISTFAIGGSLCGFLSKQILVQFEIERGPVWFIIYILVLTFTWPFCVLTISLPLGQFKFFKAYLSGIGKSISGRKQAIKMNKTRIAIFASGTGSNGQKIIEHFHHHALAEVVLIVSNKADAGVLDKAKQNNIDTLLIERDRFFHGDAYIQDLKKNRIDLIILAGFLWKVPKALIDTWPGNIINIHPALLPKYGGKGMYGQKVHEAVIAAGETESGISIHYVDELYDNGDMILQEKCTITKDDTPDTLAQKIHLLEHKHYAALIEGVINAKKQLKRN